MKSKNGSDNEKSQNAAVLSAIAAAVLIALAIQHSCSRPQRSKVTDTLQPVDSEMEPTHKPFDPASATTKSETVPGPNTPTASEPAQPSRPPLSPEQVAKKRDQMKSALASVYTAELAYRAEYDRFSTDLGALGYRPDEGELGFKVGFAEAFDPGPLNEGEVPTRKTTDAYLGEKDETGQPYFKYDPYASSADLTQYANRCRTGCTARVDSFEVMAATNLDDDPTQDVWIIDSQKNLIHLVDDEKE